MYAVGERTTLLTVATVSVVLLTMINLQPSNGQNALSCYNCFHTKDAPKTECVNPMNGSTAGAVCDNAKNYTTCAKAIGHFTLTITDKGTTKKFAISNILSRFCARQNHVEYEECAGVDSLADLGDFGDGMMFRDHLPSNFPMTAKNQVIPEKITFRGGILRCNAKSLRNSCNDWPGLHIDKPLGPNNKGMTTRTIFAVIFVLNIFVICRKLSVYFVH